MLQTDAAPEVSEAVETETAPQVPETEGNETKDAPDLARRFAALSRREKQIQEKAKAASQRERELQEKWSKYEEYEKARNNAKLDPLAYLEASGLSYKEITEKILEDGDLSPEQKAERIAEAKINEYAKSQEEKAAERERAREEAERKAKDEKLIAEYKQGIAAACADVEKYELINFEGDAGHDLVFEVAAEHFEKSGEIMDPQVAAEHVEKYLETRYKKLLELNKFKTQAPEETQQGGSNDWIEERQPPRTLTNRNTSAVASPPSSPSAYQSDDERKAAAARYLEQALSGKR